MIQLLLENYVKIATDLKCLLLQHCSLQKISELNGNCYYKRNLMFLTLITYHLNVNGKG